MFKNTLKVLVRIEKNVHSRQNSNVAFIGLGQMGHRMVNNLIKNGKTPRVYDVVPSAITSIKGATPCSSAEEAVDGANIIITMLPNGQIVKDTIIGEKGILKKIAKNALLLDSSTVGPQVARELYQASKEVNVRFLDAPVSGGVVGAQAGTLCFMVGGNEPDCKEVEPILLHMGAKVLFCGGPGAGQITKLCNNLILGVTMIGTAEAMNLGVKLGLDPKLLTDVVNISTGRSWSSDTYNPVPGVMENVPAAKDYEGGFSVELIAKDLGLAGDAALSISAPIPLAAMSHQLFRTMITYGLGKKDFSVIYKFLEGAAVKNSDVQFPDFLGIVFNPDMDNFGTGLPLEPKIKTEVVEEPQSVCNTLTVQTTSAVTPTIKTENEDCPTLQESGSNFRTTQSLYSSTFIPPSTNLPAVPNGYIRIKEEPLDVLQDASNEISNSNAERRDIAETFPPVETKKYNCKASGCPFKTDIFYLFRQHRVYHQVFHKFNGHLKCSYCSFCCNTQTTLTWHLFQHIDAQHNWPGSSDSSRTAFFECQYCFIKCDSRRQLSLHLKLHKKNMKIKDKTNRTRKKDWKSKLKKYIASCLKGSNYYQCPECPYKTKVKNRLWFIIHFIQHMTMAGEECSLCTYKSTILGIKSHLLVHVRKKTMLKCCSCQRRFRVDCDLFQHVREEHNIQLMEFKIVLERQSLETSDKSQDTELPMEKITVPEQIIKEILEEIVGAVTEQDPHICNGTYSNTDSITYEVKTELICEETEKPEENLMASRIDEEIISLEAENSTESCSSTNCTSLPELDLDEEFDTIQAVIFSDQYYDAPDDTTLNLLTSIQQTPITFNPFRHLETEVSSSCYIFNIDKEEVSSEGDVQQSEVDGVVTTQQSNNSVPSITITITGNTNNAELIQSTVMTEILKSLEFSKLQSNNDENDNLDPVSMDPKLTEKQCELVNVTPVCEESIDCFSSINVNEIEQKYIDQNHPRESFSSSFSEHISPDDSSNEELSDVPKETDLMFEDIVGKFMEVPKNATETNLKRNVKLSNSISESDKVPLSKSLETLSYDELIKYNDPHETCLDLFQDLCEFENGDDSLRCLKVNRKHITPDNSSENAYESLDLTLNINEKSKDSFLSTSNVQVSKISEEVILFDYSKIKNISSPFRNHNEESHLDNHSTTTQVPSMEPSPINVNIQDMQVVFDVPVESDSNQIKRQLQNTLNSNAIEFFVIPNDVTQSPKQVDFEEVARVPAVLELIGATSEVRSNNDECRLLENSGTNLDNDQIEEDYSNRSDVCNNFKQKTGTTTLIQNGKVVTDVLKYPVQTIFSCQHCPVRFTNNFQLKLHQHLHKSKLGVKCPFCTYRANKTIILKHLLFHAVQNDSSYKCPLCGTKKRNIVFLLDHLKVDHSREVFRTHDRHCKKRSYQLCNGCCGS